MVLLLELTNPYRNVRREFRAAALSAAMILAGCISVPTTPESSTPDASGMVKKSAIEIVDCLLPGQIRHLGSMTYSTPRSPVRTTTRDCEIRGGEYIAFDRADYKTALQVWMESAQSGNAEAQNNVGEILERGVGGNIDYATAATWYQKASDQGFPRASFNLATLYERGLGVEKDPIKALNLYRIASGVPEDNIIFASAVSQETKKLREDLDRLIEEKDVQIHMLQQQLRERDEKIRKGKTISENSEAELKGLKRLISQLELDRGSASAKRETLTATLREPKSLATVQHTASGDNNKLSDLDFGRYFALVIGDQNYRRIEHLSTPINDADGVTRVLKEKYGFRVTELSDADDAAILEAIGNISGLLRPNDNVLIYYAGHGYRRKSQQSEAGYWLPINADPPPTDTYWIANEQITAQLERLPAKRVLVVADSCYSGLLSDEAALLFADQSTSYSDEYIRFKLPKRARLLLSSGGDNPVTDSGGGNDSVFAEAFIETLKSNTGTLGSAGLFAQVKKRITAWSAAHGFLETPELKAMRSAGHELGDFFFQVVQP